MQRPNSRDFKAMMTMITERATKCLVALSSFPSLLVLFIMLSRFVAPRLSGGAIEKERHRRRFISDVLFASSWLSPRLSNALRGGYSSVVASLEDALLIELIPGQHLSVYRRS